MNDTFSENNQSKRKEEFSAVSLKYTKNLNAPVITAKEKGVLARKMVAIARENNIPVVEDKLTENILSLSEIGECIPEETWSAVAVIFAMISEMEGDFTNEK